MKAFLAALIVAPWLLGCPFDKKDDGASDPLSRLRDNPTGSWRLTLTETRQSYTLTVTGDRTSFNGFEFWEVDPPVDTGGAPLVGLLLTNQAGKDYVGWLYDEPSGLDVESSMVLSVEGNDIVLGGDFETEELARLTPL